MTMGTECPMMKNNLAVEPGISEERPGIHGSQWIGGTWLNLRSQYDKPEMCHESCSKTSVMSRAIREKKQAFRYANVDEWLSPIMDFLIH